MGASVPDSISATRFATLRRVFSPTVPEASQYSVDNIVVGRSARMRAVFDFVRVVADSDSSVLITGETGTGK